MGQRDQNMGLVKPVTIPEVTNIETGNHSVSISVMKRNTYLYHQSLKGIFHLFFFMIFCSAFYKAFFVRPYLTWYG